MKPLIPRLQTAANLAGAAALTWFIAPLISWNEHRPFDGNSGRLELLGAAALALLCLGLGVRWLRARRNARLVEKLQDSHPASDVLAERFDHAMHLLRSGVAVKGVRQARWWQSRRLLYQLPWHMFIGAPGAGKTTALLHAGLRFPLAERLGAAPVAGVGGTRQCDWWFTEQAVFIDTAGRYTTQDSQSASDAHEWLTFLQLLRRYRPVQPINGVIVTVSVPDLLQGGAELDQQAAAVDRRLQELRERLGQRFPVYLLVTKADLIAGFVEFFADLDATQREQLWGVTFEAEPSSAAPWPLDVGARLAALPSRLAAMTPRRLQEEPLVHRRASIYHFAAQLDALLPAIEGFARQAFRGVDASPRQPLRGVFLSSGTQEGNPIDRVLGELSRNFGVALRAPARAVESGKAFFLADLLLRLVIPEAPLAGRTLQRRRRQRWLAAGFGGTVAAGLLLACAAWFISYRSNLDYVDAVQARVQKVTREIDPARQADIGQLLPVYALLSSLAHSGSVDPGHSSWQLDFGLFQGPRLSQSAQQTYQRVLERTLAPRLVERLEHAIRREGDPAARYEALRIGLMLSAPGHLRRDEVRRWAAQTFAADAGAGVQRPGPGAGEQREWLQHLDALLERNAVSQLFRLDDATVRAARAALVGVPIAQRVHERLMRRAREQLAGDQTLAELASPAAAVAFAPQDAGTAPSALAAVFTRQAWRDVIEPAIEPTIAEVAEESAWVLGESPVSMQRLVRERAPREPVAREVAQLHAQAAIAQWDRLLASVSMQPPGDAATLGRVSGLLASPDSPLRLVLRRVAQEFTAAPATASSAASQAYDAALGEHFADLREYAQVSGSAAVDRLVAPISTLLGEPAGARGVELVRELRAEASRTPPPLRSVWVALADSLGAQQRRAVEQQVGGALADLGQACRRLTAERFPFAADARRDMPLADFARLFGPSGLLESFFRTRLAGQVDMRTRPWRLLNDAAPSEKVQATLRSFEMAEDIRRLFFPAKDELPQLRLQITPTAMDDELLSFSADVDGQLLRYENGPRRPKAIVWPGPAATQRVLLRILPPGPNGVGAEVHDGPWALLRVLLRGGLQRSSGTSASSRLEVDGRALKVEIGTDGAGSAALLAALGQFRCPEAW